MLIPHVNNLWILWFFFCTGSIFFAITCCYIVSNSLRLSSIIVSRVFLTGFLDVFLLLLFNEGLKLIDLFFFWHLLPLLILLDISHINIWFYVLFLLILVILDNRNLFFLLVLCLFIIFYNILLIDSIKSIFFLLGLEEIVHSHSDFPRLALNCFFFLFLFMFGTCQFFSSLVSFSCVSTMLLISLFFFLPAWFPYFIHILFILLLFHFFNCPTINQRVP